MANVGRSTPRQSRRRRQPGSSPTPPGQRTNGGTAWQGRACPAAPSPGIRRIRATRCTSRCRSPWRCRSWLMLNNRSTCCGPSRSCTAASLRASPFRSREVVRPWEIAAWSATDVSDLRWYDEQVDARVRSDELVLVSRQLDRDVPGRVHEGFAQYPRGRPGARREHLAPARQRRNHLDLREAPRGGRRGDDNRGFRWTRRWVGSLGSLVSNR